MRPKNHIFDMSRYQLAYLCHKNQLERRLLWTKKMHNFWHLNLCGHFKVPENYCQVTILGHTHSLMSLLVALGKGSLTGV